MDLDAQIERIRAGLYAGRARQRFWGWLLGLLGLLTLADSGLPFPVPLVGLPSVLVGLGITAAGGLLLYRHQELPLPEALEVARLHQGFLSAPLLIRTLHVTPATAERLLAELSRRGYTQVHEQALEGGEVSYRVLGLEAPPPPPSLPPS
jgi:hypothetical protein